MQGVELVGKGIVLTYVIELEFRKQRSRSPSCNSLLIKNQDFKDVTNKQVLKYVQRINSTRPQWLSGGK